MHRRPTEPHSENPRKQRVIVVIGAPGSGKGTTCQLASELQHGLVHLSTGDICRDEVARQTSLGQRFQSYMEKGSFVPDQFMIDIIMNRLSQPDLQQATVLLDGFPRTLHQAQVIAQSLNIDRVVLLQAPDELCVSRILNRRIDPLTNAVFNLKHLKPPSDEILARLTTREHDNNETFVRRRLRTYHLGIAAILNIFKGKIFVMDADQPIEDVGHAMVNIIGTEIPRPAVDVKQKEVVKVDNKGNCVMCLTSPADFLVTPCGHQCGCENCLQRLMNESRRCPICRTNIMSVIKVFQSGVVSDEDAEMAAQASTQPQDAMDIHEITARWITPPRCGTSSASIELQAAPCETAVTNCTPIGITIRVPDVEQKTPVDICCVLDISGSMGSDAEFQDPNDETKRISEGFTQLDLVKHAVKTIILTLAPEDRLSITAFNTRAFATLPMTQMNESGKQNAIAAVEALDQQNSTNIWAGLFGGLESMRTGSQVQWGETQRNRFLFFLTDGQPVDSPPEGEAECLKKYFENHPDFKCMVSTFGFGYDLRSKLLLDIAEAGGGTFSFIPDAKILGTCFVNAVANARSCISVNAKLHLTLQGSSFAPSNPVAGGYSTRAVPWGLVSVIGPLHAGQNRDLVVSILNLPKGQPYLQATLEYETATGSTVKIQKLFDASVPTADSTIAAARSICVDAMQQLFTKCDANDPSGIADLKIAIGKLTGLSALTHDELITKLLADLSGRVSKAVSTVERYKRWGAHYIRATFRAHQFQLRTNFMDPGLQLYGGTQFKSLVESGGKIFLTIKMKRSNEPVAPRRAAQPVAPRSAAQVRAPATPPPEVQNVTYYGGECGGCFAPCCTVKTMFGETKRFDNIRRGDFLLVSDGGFAKVRCIVELCFPRTDLVAVKETDGLVITPGHPLRMSKDSPWQRSRLVATGPAQSAASVYNVVLDRQRVALLVNGIECVTFGHEIQEVFHPFYGTNEVVERLSLLPGFSDGYVLVKSPTIRI